MPYSWLACIQESSGTHYYKLVGKTVNLPYLLSYSLTLSLSIPSMAEPVRKHFTMTPRSFSLLFSPPSPCLPSLLLLFICLSSPIPILIPFLSHSPHLSPSNPPLSPFSIHRPWWGLQVAIYAWIEECCPALKGRTDTRYYKICALWSTVVLGCSASWHANAQKLSAKVWMIKSWGGQGALIHMDSN